MTTSQMEVILNYCSISTDKWTAISNIAQINLDSDGNEIICDYNIYYFDTDDEVVKVKQGYHDSTGALKPATGLSYDYCVAFEHIAGFTFGTPYSDIK